MLEKCTIPRQKIKKKSGEGAVPRPRPLPYKAIGDRGRGHPLPKFHPIGACGALTLAPSALDMCLPVEYPGSASSI